VVSTTEKYKSEFKDLDKNTRQTNLADFGFISCYILSRQAKIDEFMTERSTHDELLDPTPITTPTTDEEIFASLFEGVNEGQ
jgi:hypothetical protein